MMKITMCALVFCAVLMSTNSQAQVVSSTGTLWDLKVYDALGEHNYNVSPNGGTIPGTGIRPCLQSPFRVFKNVNGDFQEEIRITCEVGITSKITLIQTCFITKPDNSFGALKVEDGFSNYSIALSCRR